MAYKLKNIRVLLINDNPPLRHLIRSILLDLGFGSVDAAPDAETAWEMFRDDIADIIVVDWRSDKNDDMEFIRRVRTDYLSPAPHVPIIVITGHTNRERVVYARDMGVTEFLTKPFTVQALAKYLMHIIEKPRDFIIAPYFTGPDRRRREDDLPKAAKKRKKDTTISSSNYVPHTGPKTTIKKPAGKE